MAIDARGIANLVLDNFESTRFSISNMKINKLIFYSHGYCLAKLGHPLVRNHFEAWQRGPVVRVVYDSFKDFEFRPIKDRAMAFDYSVGAEAVVGYDQLDAAAKLLTLQVCEYFGNWSAEKLSQETHLPGSPWSDVWRQPSESRGLRDRIPNELIKQFFERELGKNATAH